jgi:hypothetical protein
MDRVPATLSEMTTGFMCSDWIGIIIATPSLHLVLSSVKIRACKDSGRPALSVGKKRTERTDLPRYRTWAPSTPRQTQENERSRYTELSR